MQDILQNIQYAIEALDKDPDTNDKNYTVADELSEISWHLSRIADALENKVSKQKTLRGNTIPVTDPPDFDKKFYNADCCNNTTHAVGRPHYPQAG